LFDFDLEAVLVVVEVVDEFVFTEARLEGTPSILESAPDRLG